MSKRDLVFLCLLPAFLIAGTPSLPAQPPAPTVQQPSAEEDPGAEKPLTLREEIVVTANRIESPADETGSSVTVIGREEIERRHEPLVVDLLRTVPGVEVGQSGGPGTTASVFLRGGNSNHTLVLIDGVRVTNPSGGFDFSSLRSDNVERIEVLRGPQSTLYGSEAIGGVISITTRRGRPGFHYDVDARAGSFGTREIVAGADGGTGRFDYSFSVADRETDGFSTASELRGNREDDPSSDLTASARLGAAFLGDGRVDLVLRHFDAETGLDGFTFGVGPTDDLNYEQQRRLSVASLKVAKPVTPFWDLRFHASGNREALKGTDPDTFFNAYDIHSRLFTAGVESGFKLGTGDVLLAGVSTERRTGENAGSYDESLDLDSVFLQNNWSWRDRLFVTAGVRHDSYSRSGGETTYRVTGSYSFPSSWRVHGSYGTGFRAPSFDELFFPFLGNLSLRPETSQGFDLGVERTFRNGAVSAGVTAFSNRFEDLISFDPFTNTLDNIRRANSEGVEASLRVQPSNAVEAQATYTYNETEDGSTGEPLARRPRHRLTLLTAFEPTERLRGTASLVAADDRIDSDGTKMDSYNRVDLSLEYSVRSWLQPYVMVRNLLDEDYEEVSGYTSPGLSAFLGLRLRSR
jgi:vitamin B12 transporter